MPEKKRKRVKHRSEEPLRVNELIREIERLEEKLAATESRLSKQITQLEEHVSYLENLTRLAPIAPWKIPNGIHVGDPPPGTAPFIGDWPVGDQFLINNQVIS